MHQDVLSEKFCGEGIPLWAAQSTAKFKFPYPVLNLTQTFRFKHPVPTRQDCAKKNWPQYYEAIATGSA